MVSAKRRLLLLAQVSAVAIYFQNLQRYHEPVLGVALVRNYIHYPLRLIAVMIALQLHALVAIGVFQKSGKHQKFIFISLVVTSAVMMTTPSWMVYLWHLIAQPESTVPWLIHNWLMGGIYTASMLTMVPPNVSRYEVWLATFSVICLVEILNYLPSIGYVCLNMVLAAGFLVGFSSIPGRRVLVCICLAVLACFQLAQPQCCSTCFDPGTLHFAANQSETVMLRNWRILARTESRTGWVTVVDDADLNVRFMRCGHSFLGGTWLDSRGQLTLDTIYGIFHVMEAAAFVQRNRSIDSDDRALHMYVGHSQSTNHNAIQRPGYWCDGSVVSEVL